MQRGIDQRADWSRRPRSALCCAAAVWLALASVSAAVAQSQPDSARVAGSDRRVAALRSETGTLLDFAAAARAFDWEPKVPSPGRLATVCRTGKAEYCVPVPLVEGKFRETPDGLFVEAESLGKALGFTVATEDGTLVLTARPANAAKTAATDQPFADSGEQSAPPAYNAAWGEGRGFQVGQTLPDIPLYDLDGNEVRFSRFLGRQTIIYCWASW
ncbi:MAG: hypothetical protein WD069_21975 [Planctomycetales bacterium]